MKSVTKTSKARNENRQWKNRGHAINLPLWGGLDSRAMGKSSNRVRREKSIIGGTKPSLCCRFGRQRARLPVEGFLQALFSRVVVGQALEPQEHAGGER